jgi:hypothetical protein
MRTPQSQMGAMLAQKKSAMTVVIGKLGDRAIDALLAQGLVLLAKGFAS